MAIHIKTPQEIEYLREAGKIVAETHLYLQSQLAAGISTYEIDRLGEEFIRKFGAVPSFLNYDGYPASICISINEEVVHGIPSKKRFLKEGDVVSIDIGAYKNGYHGDAARTHIIGNAPAEVKRLVEVTKESFFKGMEMVKPGNHLYQISGAIQQYVESNGFSVVRDLVGHGVGKELHEEPQIPNYRPVGEGRGPKLQKGMVIAVEPMVNMGRPDVRILSDDWTIVTLDKSLSAHYEHTLVITDTGYELLTM